MHVAPSAKPMEPRPPSAHSSRGRQPGAVCQLLVQIPHGPDTQPGWRGSADAPRNRTPNRRTLLDERNRGKTPRAAASRAFRDVPISPRFERLLMEGEPR